MGWTDVEDERGHSARLARRHSSASVKALSLRFERASTTSSEDSVSVGKDVGTGTVPASTPKQEKPVGLRDGKKGLGRLVSFFESFSRKSTQKRDLNGAPPEQITLPGKRSSTNVDGSTRFTDKPSSVAADINDDGAIDVFSLTTSLPPRLELANGSVENAKHSSFSRTPAADAVDSDSPGRASVLTPPGDGKNSAPHLRYSEFMAAFSSPATSTNDAGRQQSTEIRTRPGIVMERTASFSSLPKTSQLTSPLEKPRVRHYSADAAQSTPKGAVEQAKQRLSFRSEGHRDGLSDGHSHSSATPGGNGAATPVGQSDMRVRRRSSSCSDVAVIPGGIASKAKSQYLEEAAKTKVKQSTFDVYGRGGPSKVATSSGLTPVKRTLQATDA